MTDTLTRRRRLLLLLGMLLIAAALVTQASCATRIIPPASVENPVTVYVVDYGRHSSLVMPDQEGILVEYAYGEWLWFAENRSQWYRVGPTLFFPTRGTLGRWSAGGHHRPTSIEVVSRGARTLSLTVERGLVSDLMLRLDEIHAQTDDPLYNPAMRLYFADHPRSYWFGFNCNHAVAGWLRDLDCRIIGWPLLSNFRLDGP
ncbi:MAG: hypothetical protein JJU36_04115 [Phycisphaeraceae bacterium]|nr:hypothetical protein [Phycisphaeraceae bacterium]